ncbi:hypothetical protein M5689_006275 [Euphorbia peplus]|nr:hypothetical protein M5689_006275 [Euphorbia peplus]
MSSCLLPWVTYYPIDKELPSLPSRNKFVELMGADYSPFLYQELHGIQRRWLFSHLSILSSFPNRDASLFVLDKRPYDSE